MAVEQQKLTKKGKKNYISIKFKVLLLVAGRLVDSWQSIDDIGGVIYGSEK